MPLERNEYTVSAKRAGSYIMSAQPSEISVYTSQFLTEYERRFFIDNLQIESIEFSGESNCQMFCRTLIHDLAKPFTGQFVGSVGEASSIARGSETILCLHAFGKLTTSWTWIKFAVTMFRQGFNVVMVDLPGFGKSSISRDIRCPLTTWRRWEVPIITTLLSNLGLKRINVMACYESASIFFHIIREYPQILGRNHILHNPILSASEMGELDMSSIIKRLLTAGMKRRIFVSFDRTEYTEFQGIPNNADANHALAMSLSHSLIVSERYIRQISKSLGFNQIMIAPISSFDLAEVCFYTSESQPGMRPIYALYPSKKYRIYACQFMAGENLVQLPPTTSLPVQSQFVSNDMKKSGGSVGHLTAQSESNKMLSPSVGQNSMGEVSSPQLGMNGSMSPRRASSKPNSKALTVIENNYSYGVRLRNMQDNITLQLALKLSEDEYREQFGESELGRFQKLADTRSKESWHSGVRHASYIDTRMMSFQTYRGNTKQEDVDPLVLAAKQQEEVEAQIRRNVQREAARKSLRNSLKL